MSTRAETRIPPEDSIEFEVLRTRNLVERALHRFGERRSKREFEASLKPTESPTAKFYQRIALIYRQLAESDIRMRQENMLARFRGQLSTMSSKVGPYVNPNTLTGMSEMLSRELQRCLNLDNPNAPKKKPIQSQGNGRINFYLKEGKMIIDAAIGQNLRGNAKAGIAPHRHVFVGTPDMLMDTLERYSYADGLWLPANQTTKKDLIIGPRNVEQFYQDLWGNGLEKAKAAQK